jgi:aspartyl/asparaginyl beta-hydroxylase (cupin superfamily)
MTAGPEQSDVTALIRGAEEALRRGDKQAAFELLRQAEARAPKNVSVHLTKALAWRAAGDVGAALRSLDAALVLDPYNFLAMLSKGWLVEQQGQTRRAATIYRDALALAPPPDRVPPGMAAPLARAREAVAANSKALKAHLLERVKEVRARYAGEPLDRFDESVAILAGETHAYVQQPIMLHYPRLPAIPFYDREYFPWLDDLEASTPIMQEELAGLLEQTGTEKFAPYIAYPPGAPINQWGELNHSRKWSSFFFWRDGVRQDEACERCPRTAAVLESLPMARQTGFAPTAMFSALEAHATIPPHTGSINTRVIVHLPLILPGDCRFRVGNVTRPWRMNEAWVFDDTIEHEAWNDADELRIILIFDVWNPLLSEAERELLTVMLLARNEFHAMG